MYHFFAMLSRMKYINRWGLMRNTRDENISEHSLETALIAHALAMIGNQHFQKNYDPQRAAVLALFHDATEIITGDLPTPVKYHSEEIRRAYAQVEEVALERLVGLLPEELRDKYRELLTMSAPGDEALKPLVKAADRISALIKCMEERQSGNQDFREAERGTQKALEEMALPEAEFFAREFLPSYQLTLDEQNYSSTAGVEIAEDAQMVFAKALKQKP
ncbi:MAG: 5'-deoxynucleotidase [Acutalibacter sp.]|nr:5'-deoxynucleotidase [Acutalibacter sp.]